MVRIKNTETTDGRLVRSAAWVDRKLTPVFGPPPVGPYADDGRAPVSTCPVCGHPMAEHRIDHSARNAILECPAPIDHNLEFNDHSPLDELGMPLHGPRPAKKGR